MKTPKIIIMAVLVAFFCCSGGAAEKAVTAGLATLTMPDGSKVEAELALTGPAQARGLMYRESLAYNAGMLFVFQSQESRTFWMKNTYISLDIVFLDGDMKVQNIFHRVPRSVPGQPEQELSKVSAPARYVLELAAGKARKCGLKPGSVIKSSFQPAKKAPAAKSASPAAAGRLRKQ